MNSAGQGETILFARHVDVGEKDRDVGMVFKYVEGLVSPTGFIGRPAGVLESLARDHAENRLVIDDQHDMLAGLLIGHGC